MVLDLDILSKGTESRMQLDMTGGHFIRWLKLLGNFVNVTSIQKTSDICQQSNLSIASPEQNKHNAETFPKEMRPPGISFAQVSRCMGVSSILRRLAPLMVAHMAWSS